MEDAEQHLKDCKNSLGICPGGLNCSGLCERSKIVDYQTMHTEQAMKFIEEIKERDDIIDDLQR